MTYPDSKVHGANMGPTWVLSAPGGPHAGLMSLSIWVAANRKSQGISSYSIDPVLLEYSSLITVAAIIIYTGIDISQCLTAQAKETYNFVEQIMKNFPSNIHKLISKMKYSVRKVKNFGNITPCK